MNKQKPWGVISYELRVLGGAEHYAPRSMLRALCIWPNR